MLETSTPWMTVVGEIDDVKMASPDGITLEQIYQPATQLMTSEGAFASAMELNGDFGYIVLRTSSTPKEIENALLATVRKIDPKLPLNQIQTMQHVITESEAPRRFNTILISSFASVAVVLAVLGVYSVIAFSTALREQEIAIRMALGCQRSRVFKLVLLSSAKLATTGCILGLLGTVVASNLLRSFLFGVSPFDPAMLAISAISIVLLSLAVSTLPARRAVKTALMQTIRTE
jgi:ABC-type antimicrobial peptide transport system permease subunit